MALLTVVFAHFWPANEYGGLGVELFFVLSGRLMAGILFIEQAQIGPFLLRRFARVYPAMLVYCLTIYFVYRHTQSAPDLLSLVTALTFTFNYIQDWHYCWLFAHLWSLCVEEHSYLLLVIVALAQRRFGIDPLILVSILTAAAFANGVYLTEFKGVSYIGAFWRSDVRFASIGFGVIAYLLVQRGRPDSMDRLFAGGIFIALLASGLYLGVDGHAPRYVLFSLGTASLAFAVALVDLTPPPLQLPFAMRPITDIGVLSYSLYLWQEPFSLMHRHQSTAILIFVILWALAMGMLSYHVVEKPTRKWIRSINLRFADSRDRRAALARSI